MIVIQHEHRASQVLFGLFCLCLALVWLAPFAGAMVPGPVEKDDHPPPKNKIVELPEPEPEPEPVAKLPESVNLANIATYEPQVYNRCFSFGYAGGGALRGGVLFPRDTPFYLANRADQQWATPEMVDVLLYAARRVREQYGASHKLVLGDISYRNGGRLRGHASHQAGRDADVGFFSKSEENPGFFKRGDAENLDIKRNWTYLEALLETNAIEAIYLDYQLQEIFYNYAKNRLHYPEEYLERAFQYPRGAGARYGIIRHARGHNNHFHIRVTSPLAVNNARNHQPFDDPQLAQLQSKMQAMPVCRPVALPTPAVKPAPVPAREEAATQSRREVEIVYIVRYGDSLWSIAEKFNITVGQLRAWNNLESKARLRIGQKLTVYPVKPRAMEKAENPS